MQQEQKRVDLRGLALVAAVGAWSAGIFIDSLVLLPSRTLLIGAASTLILILLLWHDSKSRLFVCMLLCLFLGAWRYSVSSLANDPLALSPSKGVSVMVRGTVSEEPKLYGKNHLLSISDCSISRDKGMTWQDAHGQLTVQEPGTEIEDPYGANYGSVVELQGKLLPPLPQSTPDVLANMFFPQIRVTATVGNPILAMLYSWRVRLSNIIEQVLPQPAAALLVAILLGLRTPALHPLVAAFNETDTTHLIVSSGFKVTLLAGLIANSTRWLYSDKIEQGKLLPAQKRGGWRRWLSTAIVIVSIAAYTILNGAGAAAIRSGIMGELLVIAPRIGRTYNVYTALAFTALLMSLINSFIIWDASFQLSFLGTLGIVLFTPYFQRLLRPIERLPVGYILNENIAVTLAAQVATWPLLALYFHVFSRIALVTNVLTVPLLGILILLGVLICGIGLLFMPFAPLIGWVVFPLVSYVDFIVQNTSKIPHAFKNTDIPVSVAWLYYAILTLLVIIALRKWPIATLEGEHDTKQKQIPGLSQSSWKLIQLGLALLVIIATVLEQRHSPSNTYLTVTFLHVTTKGQSAGEAILLRTPDGKTLLIDGGMDAVSLGQELNSNLPSWQHSLDAVILTTPRQDHINGLLDIIQRYKIGAVIDGGMLHPTTTYARWRRTISEHNNIHYLTVSQNTNISIGRFVSLQILWPAPPLHKGSNEVRDNGLILRIVTPRLRILLLGAGAQSTYALSGLLNMDTTSLQAEVVQMIEESSTPFPKELDAVLQRAHPTWLVMTPAASNKKQQARTPSASPLQKRAWQNIPTLYTAQAGTVQITSNQLTWSVNTV